MRELHIERSLLLVLDGVDDEVIYHVSNPLTLLNNILVVEPTYISGR